MQLLCALAFSVLSSSVAAGEAKKRQFRPKRGDFGPKRTRIPDFDRLVIRSRHNLAPSGENCTEMMALLWALLFSVFSSSVAAWEAEASV